MIDEVQLIKAEWRIYASVMQAIIGWDNGASPIRRQAIISTNAGVLLIRPRGANFSEILIEIHISSFKKMHLKLPSGKCRPFCLGLHVLTLRRVGDSCVRSWSWLSLLQIMAWRLFETKPSSAPMMAKCQLDRFQWGFNENTELCSHLYMFAKLLPYLQAWMC